MIDCAGGCASNNCGAWKFGACLGEKKWYKPTGVDIHACIYKDDKCNRTSAWACLHDHSHCGAMKSSRLPVWKGVTATQVCEVLKTWLVEQRCSSLTNAFQDLAGLHFNLAPRLKVMMRFSGLAKSLIRYARNGVLSGNCFIDAMWELRRLEPRFENFGSAKKRDIFILEVSKGIRTLLSWWREFYKGGASRETLWRQASDLERKVLEDVSSGLVIPEEKKKGKKMEAGEKKAEQRLEANEKKLENSLMEASEKNLDENAEMEANEKKFDENSKMEAENSKMEAGEKNFDETSKMEASEKKGDENSKMETNEKNWDENSKMEAIEKKFDETSKMEASKKRFDEISKMEAEKPKMEASEKKFDEISKMEASEKKFDEILEAETQLVDIPKKELDESLETPAKLPRFWKSFTSSGMSTSPSSVSSSSMSLGPMSSMMPMPSSMSSTGSLGFIPMSSNMPLPLPIGSSKSPLVPKGP